MSERTIVITEPDKKRLTELLDEARRTGNRGAGYLKDLQVELDRARVVLPTEVPPDVITMNSTASLRDLDTGDELTYTLVFPQDTDTAQGRISVLAPIGTAMLGYAVGDTFVWRVPDGQRRFRVERVLYQPEAAGDYHL